MTFKEKAEAYVRQQLPELMEPKSGCRVTLKGDAWHEVGVMIRNQRIDNITTGKVIERTSDWEIIGHPIQLQHWLRVLSEIPDCFLEFEDYGARFSVWLCYGDDNYSETVTISYTDGQPINEADYQAFCNIVGI